MGSFPTLHMIQIDRVTILVVLFIQTPIRKILLEKLLLMSGSTAQNRAKVGL